MAAEEAFEAWVFDQNVFNEPVAPAEEAVKSRAAGQGRKPKKQQEPQAEDGPD
jgi:hypothetical protein